MKKNRMKERIGGRKKRTEAKGREREGERERERDWPSGWCDM